MCHDQIRVISICIFLNIPCSFELFDYLLLVLYKVENKLLYTVIALLCCRTLELLPPTAVGVRCPL